jgi:hypothetical protein
MRVASAEAEAQVQVPLWEARVQDNCWVPNPRYHPFSLTTNHYRLSLRAPLHHPSAMTSLHLDLQRQTSHDTLAPQVVPVAVAVAVAQHCAEVRVVAVVQRLKREITVV